MNVDKEFSMKHLNLELPLYFIVAGSNALMHFNDLAKFSKLPKIKLLFTIQVNTNSYVTGQRGDYYIMNSFFV